MSDVGGSSDMVPFGLPMGLPRGPPALHPGPFTLGPPLLLTGSFTIGTPIYVVPHHIHHHPPGEHCFFCACEDCRYFFGVPIVPRCVTPRTLDIIPRYSDLGFVNTMRAAAAKREEVRQEKLQAERDQAAAAEATKKEKAPKEQPKKKNLRQNMKRRRQ